MIKKKTNSYLHTWSVHFNGKYRIFSTFNFQDEYVNNYTSKANNIASNGLQVEKWLIYFVRSPLPFFWYGHVMLGTEPQMLICWCVWSTHLKWIVFLSKMSLQGALTLNWFGAEFSSFNANFMPSLANKQFDQYEHLPLFLGRRLCVMFLHSECD